MGNVVAIDHSGGLVVVCTRYVTEFVHSDFPVEGDASNEEKGTNAATGKFRQSASIEYNIAMKKYFLVSMILTIVFAIGCSNATTANQNTGGGKAYAPPAKNLTEADVANLKWIEGTWRGMDGDKPFFERYHFEGTTMVVESLKDEKLEVEDADRFELVNGEFGKGEDEDRSAASEITETSVQFVPAIAGSANSFRFERQDADTWNAILEWQAKGDKPAGRKVYVMKRIAGK